MNYGFPVTVFQTSDEACERAGQEVAETIRTITSTGQTCVLGLATGTTPIGVYKQLVSMHKAGQLSFSNVMTFNLDEYYPMQPTNDQSYWWFMHQQLFNHVDIPTANINIPPGTLSTAEIDKFCTEYEGKIKAAGGLDLQLLGIGRNGHIGFNEAPSAKDSITRRVQLAQTTREDAANDFGGLENVPTEAITMGVATIMAARRAILMAWSEKKAPTVAAALEGPITPDVPASFLREHRNAVFYLDKAAASRLKAQLPVSACTGMFQRQGGAKKRKPMLLVRARYTLQRQAMQIL